MADGPAISALSNQFGLTPATTKTEQKSLGQDDFLKILITQLQHQDPFDPQDNGEFITQMASFGTVEGIGKLQQSFTSLGQSLYSNQALQASALVGRSVEVESNIAYLDEKKGDSQKGFDGAVKFDYDMKDVSLEIKNHLGATIRTIPMGDQLLGSKNIHWDGLDDQGGEMASGQYQMQVIGTISGDATARKLACTTYTSANVDSVTLGQQGRELNLSLHGIGEINFSDVHKIT